MKTLLEKIKSFRLNDKRILLVVVIVVLVFLMMDFNNRMVTMLQLDREEKVLKTHKVELQQTKVKLEAEITYANSDKALEEWARERARLIKEGDIPIVIMAPSDYKPTPKPPTPQEMVQMNRWDIWKELFFGAY